MAQGVKRTQNQALAYIKPMLPFLKNGLSLTTACSLAGVERKTVSRYSDEYEEVDSEIRAAKAELLAIAASTVAKAAKTDPKMALEVLKRRDSLNWGDKARVGMTDEDDKKPLSLLGGAASGDVETITVVSTNYDAYSSQNIHS